MEWARAKSIIILLLFAMNIFLASRLLMEYGNQGLSREAVADMADILASRGVEITCKVPLYEKDTPRLEFGNGVFDIDVQVERLLGFKLTSDSRFTGTELVFENGVRKLTFIGPNSFEYRNPEPGDDVNIGNIFDAEKYLKRFLKEKKLSSSAYVLDGEPEAATDSVIFNYVEKYKGFLVFDNKIRAVVTGKGVTLLEMSHRSITGFSPDTIKNISTAYQVMLENFDGSEKTVVTEITAGYKEAGTEEENELKSSDQLPVWRIKVNGRYRFFGATDGKEIIDSKGKNAP